LRQTYGERFLEFYGALEFSRENRVSPNVRCDNSDTKANLMMSVMRSRILSCLNCLRLQEVKLKYRWTAKFQRLISSRNKSEKEVAKIVSITIMRFPR